MPQLHTVVVGKGRGANLIESLEVGPSQSDAALLAFHVLHLIVTSSQVRHGHLASPAGSHMFSREAKLKSAGICNCAFQTSLCTAQTLKSNTGKRRGGPGRLLLCY